MKKIFFASVLLLLLQKATAQIADMEKGLYCHGAYYGESLSAPEATTYLWWNGSKKQKAEFYTSQIGPNPIWCVVNGKDTLRDTLWVMPVPTKKISISTETKNSKVEISAPEDTFATKQKLIKYFLLKNDEIIDSSYQNLFVLNEKEFGVYRILLQHPCTIDGWKSDPVTISLTSGTNETSSDNWAYPNPTSGILNLPNETGLVKITDMFGKTTVLKTDGLIDISFLPSGLYILESKGKTKKILKE